MADTGFGFQRKKDENMRAVKYAELREAKDLFNTGGNSMFGEDFLRVAHNKMTFYII